MTSLLGGVGWEGWRSRSLSCLRGRGNGRVLAPKPEPLGRHGRVVVVVVAGWAGARGSALEGGVYGGVRDDTE